MSRPGSPCSIGLSGTRKLLPHEYATSVIGIHTRWTSNLVDHSTPSRLWVLPSLNLKERWGSLVAAFLERLPLLVRFSRELERVNGHVFWILVLGNVAQACIPACELYFARGLIEIAHVVGTGRALDYRLFTIAFFGRVATTLASIAIDRLCTHFEEKLNARFSLTLQTEILKIHCLLDDDELESPETRKKLELLRSLGGSSVYRRFDPLGFLSVGNSALSVGLGGVMLWRQINPSNGFFLAVSVAFMVVEELDSSFGAIPAVEHWDVTNDNYLRFQSLFKLGTSRALRREVTMLGLQDYILSSAISARTSLGTTSTTLGSRHFHQHQPPLRLSTLITQLSRPLTTSLFILHTSLLSSNSTSPLVSFAEMAVLEAAAWNLRVRWASLRRGVRELRGGMESIEALYEYEKIEKRLEEKASVVPYVARTRRDDDGMEMRGMEVEFRNVTLRYDSSSVPALDNVSFKILPGQLVSIVGHNGSGKSSLVSLLSMSHKVSSGEILINGVNIDAYSRRDLAKVMSFTSQTSPVLPMTIKEYVGLGSVDDYDDEGLITKALHASTADVVVDQLADGWDSYAGGMMGATLSTDDWQLPQVVPHPPTAPTLEIVSDDLAGSACEGLGASVSSEGTLVDDSSVKEDRTGLGREKRAAHVKMTGYPTTVNGEEATISFPDHSPSPCVLSGGQWQRIALARSLMKRQNDLLVWDEPAASLDPLAEASLFDQILALRGQSTVLFTTHRFNVCSRTDRILLFAKGRLVEQGTHAELMRIEGGEYRKLWEIQARGFV